MVCEILINAAYLQYAFSIFYLFFNFILVANEVNGGRTYKMFFSCA